MRAHGCLFSASRACAVSFFSSALTAAAAHSWSSIEFMSSILSAHL